MVLAAWVVIVSALLLILPGALVGRRMNLPWPVAFAAGPAITFALVSILTVLYSAVGFQWNAVSALVGLVLALVGAWLYSRLLGTGIGRRLAPAPADTGERRVGRTAMNEGALTLEPPTVAQAASAAVAAAQPELVPSERASPVENPSGVTVAPENPPRDTP